VIAGPISLANATVAGFDLGSKLSALPSFAGASKTGGTDTTTIQTLAATVRVAPDGIRADNVNLVAPAFGTLTGGGTISPTGNLDFKMLAKLTGPAAATQISRVASLGQPSNGLPFRIQGTTASPVFVPDVSRAVSDMASGLVKNPEAAKKAVGAFGGLFARQKK
jgi:AsmA protein